MAELSVSGASLLEGDSSSSFLTYTLTLDQTATDRVSIPYRILAGTATEAEDFDQYNALVGTATINAGASQTTISVRVSGDTRVETDESVVLEVLRPLDGATELTNGALAQQAVGWVLDDDGSGPAALGIQVSDLLIREGDGGTRTALFEVELSRALTEPLRVPYELVGGAARGGADFVAKSGTVTFLPGQRVAEIPVEVRGDNVREMLESFHLALDPPAAVASVAGGTARVLSDDSGSSLPTLRVEGTRAAEGDSGSDYARFLLTLDAPAEERVSIPYRLLPGTAVMGEDVTQYNSLYGTVTIQAGQIQTELNLRVLADFRAEADESVMLEVLSPTGAQLPGGAALVSTASWILDDDGSSVRNALGVHAGEVRLLEGSGGTRTAVFELSLSRPVEEAVSIPYALQGITAWGNDFTAASGRIAFAPGQTQTTVAVEVAGDRRVEASEELTLRLDPPVAAGATRTGELVLLDDDSRSAAPVLSIEGGEMIENSAYGYLPFTLTLDRPADDTIEVSYRLRGGTATENVDYSQYNSLTGTVRFSAGEVQETLSVRLSGDSTAEVDESVILEIDRPANARLANARGTMQTAGWIQDDDTGAAVSTLALAASNLVLDEGDVGRTRGLVDLSLSRPAPTKLDVNWRLVGNAASAGSDYVAARGTVTFGAGEQDAVIAVHVRGDFAVETNERFSLVFTPPGAIAETSGGLITIRNDDGILRGSGRDDRLIDTAAVNTIVGLGGSDNIRGGAGSDRLYGGPGNDLIAAGGGIDFGFGNGGNDVLYGGGGGDTLRGGAGNDRVFGEAGADRLFGDGGNDRLDGGSWGDVLSGGSGRDTLFGRGGADRLYGGDDGDGLYGAAGNDRLYGGSGNDRLVGQAGNDQLQGQAGADYLVGGGGNDGLGGGGGGDDLRGGVGRDRLYGGAGNDQLRGGDHNDQLYGGGGNDRIWGQDGSDRIDGGGGRDVITAGAGRDVIVFASSSGRDTVTDFNPDADRIDLRAFDLDTLPDTALSRLGDDARLELRGAQLTLLDTGIGELDDVFIFA